MEDWERNACTCHVTGSMGCPIHEPPPNGYSLNGIIKAAETKTLAEIKKLNDVNLYVGADPEKVSESFTKDAARWDDSYINHSATALRKRATT